MNNGVVAQSRSLGSKDIRVLIADPDECLMAEYREHSQEGFEIITAPNGLECVERLRERAPDVLVLEPQLPWGGGDGVLAMMHDVLGLAAVPVMILTSCCDLLVLDNISCFPISVFHPKPLLPVQLVRRLYTLLESQTSRSHGEEQNLRLESLIAKKTGGRIHRLRVETVEGRIIVHGRSGTYHVRQLVLAAVMEAMELSIVEPQKVELDIQVCSNV
ncbi:MAG: two-component system response regulator [Planctomycetaceae bacterium]